MRIAIAWEDAYWIPLQRCVLARRAPLRPTNATAFIDLLQYTLRGNGNFGPHVQESWPRVSATGLPTNKGAIDHLICVADADRLPELLPGVSAAPQAAIEVSAWHASAEERFVAHLRGRAAKADPNRVHGIVLRWAKESLTLAAYDRRVIREWLGIDTSHPEVQAFLAECNPPPSGIADDQFTDTFRRPVSCVDQLRKASGLSPIGKGSSMDDVIMALDAEDMEAVARRVPDVDRLVSLAWRLATAPPSPPAGPTRPAPAGPAPGPTPRTPARKGRTKKR
jgi:hypothetical protein